MECDDCGQYSDWIGSDSDWERVGGDGQGALLECTVCGSHQHKR